MKNEISFSYWIKLNKMDIYKEIRELEDEIELQSDELTKRYKRLKELNDKRVELESNRIGNWLMENITTTLKSVTEFVKSGNHDVREYTLQKVDRRIDFDENECEPLDYQIRVTHFECYSAVEVMFKYDRQIVKEFIMKWFDENCEEFDYNEKGSSYFKGF
jgi:hypothetical protein